MNSELVYGIILAIITGILANYIGKRIPHRFEIIIMFISLSICMGFVFFKTDVSQNILLEIRDSMKDLKLVDKKQDKNNIAAEYKVGNNDSNENPTQFPYTTILPDIRSKEVRQPVVEKQQQSERAQGDYTSTRLVPNSIFTDRQEKTNNYSSAVRSNAEPIQTAKASPIYSRNSSTSSINEDFYDESVIHEVQQKLTTLGYSPGKIDGKMGQQTAKALMQFQKYNNIPMSGNLDSNTLTALSNISSQVSSALQKNNSGTTEKSSVDKIVKYLPVDKASRPEAEKLDVNTRADFKSPTSDRTVSSVNYHAIKSSNDNFVDARGNISSSFPSFVDAQGVVIPSLSNSRNVPFGGFGQQTPSEGGFNPNNGISSKSTFFNPVFSGHGIFGTTTDQSLGFTSSGLSVGQHFNAIQHR